MAGKNVKMSSGTIYRTSEKGNYYFRYQINGKRKSISLGTRRIDEAKRKAEEIINVVSAPSVEVVAAHVKLAKGWSGNHPRLEIDKAWEVYSNHPDRARPTSQKIWNLYRIYFEKFVSWLKESHPEVIYLDEIRDVDESRRKLDCNIAGEYADYLKQQPIAVDTHNKQINRISHIFKTLEKYLDAPSPWSNPKLRRTSKEEKHITAHRSPLPPDKEAAIFKLLAEDSGFRMRNKAEIEVLCYILKYTGQRQKDCVNLSWNRIDMNRRRISVTQEKTGKSVSIPIADELYVMLKKAESWRENERVLPKTAERYAKKAPDGSEIGGNLVNKQILKLFERAGITTSIAVPGRKKKLTVYGVHSFRHSFASHCAEAGIPRAVCASILGADADIIDSYYVHIGEEAQEKAIRTLSATSPQTAEARISAALQLLSTIPDKTDLLLALEKILTQ